MNLVIKLLIIAVCISVLFYLFGRLRSISDELTIEQIQNISPVSYPGHFRIATYNIAHGRGPKLDGSNWDGEWEQKKLGLIEIGKYLKTKNIDIVVLNEVDFSASWSGNLDQARIVAETGGYPYFVRQTNYDLFLPGFSLQFGNALLSRYPVKTAKRERLPPYKPAEPWFYGNHDALRVEIDLGATEISVWGLHLDVRDEQARVQAIEHVLNNLKDDQHTILAGDLNSRPATNNEATAYSTLAAYNHLISFPLIDSKHNTFPSEKPGRIIDWIFYSPQFRFKTGDVPGIHYSDHLPVLVELEIR